MSSDEDVVDNPAGWVARHIRRYVESDGEQGHEFYGYDALLLTTRGRKSGKLRRTALYYGEDAGRFLLVASNGGAHGHPAWYLNLLAHPEVEVQVRRERFPARARPATASERPRLWEQMVAMLMCARWVSRSTTAFASRGSGNTLVHSPNGRFVVTISDPRSWRSERTWKTSSAAPSGSAR